MTVGISRSDYEDATPLELAFIKKEHELATVERSTLLRDCVINAEANVNRKKGKPFRKLWRKAGAAADKEKAKNDLKIIEEIEKKERGWINKILKR